jgi:hypothetical protein
MRKSQVLAFLAACAVAASPCTARADGDLEGITAVSSKVAPDYVRKKLPNGSFVSEFYSFGAGGNWGGEFNDATIDKLTFLDVAHVIATPLAERKYVPARDPKTTGLLIMVYWGTTAVPEPISDSAAYSVFKDATANLAKYTVTLPSGKQITGGGPIADDAMDQWSAAAHMLTMVNHQRERTDFANALMLGYDSPGLIGTEEGIYTKGTARGFERDELYAEIEDNRYFVVLMAYDFQLLWKQKKHKLLWETRFSITERNNQFDKALPAMAEYASRYFGQPSNGLIRDHLKEGQVDVGEPSLIEFIAEPKK